MVRYKPGPQELRDYVQGIRTIPFGKGKNMAQEILNLRQRVAELQAGTILEAQEAPALTRIATALEKLAGCVNANVFVVGNVER